MPLNIKRLQTSTLYEKFVASQTLVTSFCIGILCAIAINIKLSQISQYKNKFINTSGK